MPWEIQPGEKNMTDEYPWDIRAVPNFASAPAVDVEDGQRLDARTFQDRYVLQNGPCLIKGAIAQWPAFRRWSRRLEDTGRHSEYRFPSKHAPR